MALPLATPHSPHAAMLAALAEAQPALMVPPEERRLYLLRAADGRADGVLRLRDSGRVSQTAPEGCERWVLREGNLELADADGHVRLRFMLCGQHEGLRLYLGERLGDRSPCMLQEIRCTYTRLSLLDPELLDPFCSLYGSDAIVPTELPAGAVLLLGSPHSRADVLAQALNQQAGLHIDGALLDPQGIAFDEPLFSPTAATTLHALRSKDAPWFARVMLSRSHDAQGRHLAGMPVRGFHMAASHSAPALEWALADTQLRIVHVARSNLLAEYADILDSHRAPGETGALHFEAERFRRFVTMRQRQLAALRERLVARNADTVEVDGSRLNEATMTELLGFLLEPAGIEAQRAPAAPIAATPVIERFANPEDVWTQLVVLGLTGWAEPEGTVVDAL